jgi:histidinol-phosphate aminotransferase
LRALARYHLDLEPCLHKLDQNEVPWDLPRRLKERVVRELLACDWARYPDFHSDALRRELGALHGHPPDGVLVGNGSNELLAVTLTALVSPGAEVLGAEPSFGLYPGFVLKAGGIPRFLPPRADLALPFAELLAEVEREPRRPLLLCSPNNPTGGALSVEEVERLLERIEAPLLLDNAYAEFCRYDYRPLLAGYPQLILFRTFSKAWSLAGLRLGYLLADPRLVSELIKVKLPYNVGIAGAAAGRAVLGGAREAGRRVSLLIGRRPQWAESFREAGYQVLPSEANFVLVRCGSPARAAALQDLLERRSIRVRDVGRYPGLAGALRVSIGGSAALRAVRRALRGEADPVRREPAPIEALETASSGASTASRPPAARTATVERATSESRIRLALRLEGGERRIAVPDGFFAHMLNALATHGGLGLELEAAGDTEIDLHHTVEDVGIALGEALAAALGERRGIVRFASAFAPLDEALARAVVDLSGRGFFAYSAPPEIAAAWVTPQFPLTLAADFFQAFADRGRLTLHLDILSARNGHHAAEAAFKAVALALRQAVSLRSTGGPAAAAATAPDIPSTKGTLSA